MENSKQPAFPEHLTSDGYCGNGLKGLSKRDYIATLAMQSFAQHAIAETFQSVAESSVKMADALLKALEK